jgi:hypothetical protein
MSEAYTTLSAGLTTIFTPPASCSTSWTYEGEYFNALSDGLLMQNVLSNFDTRCWPASFTGNGRANGLSNFPIQIYSPGICPSGYTTAAGFTDSGTTTEICCLRWGNRRAHPTNELANTSIGTLPITRNTVLRITPQTRFFTKAAQASTRLFLALR